MVKCGLVVIGLQVAATGGDRDLRGPRLRRLKSEVTTDKALVMLLCSTFCKDGCRESSFRIGDFVVDKYG